MVHTTQQEETMEKIRRSILMGGGNKTLLLGFALLVIALVVISCEQPNNNVADYITTADGTWEIYTAQGLLDWNAYVMKNTGTADKPDYPNIGTSAILMADISLEGKIWTPVGCDGVVDGRYVEYYYAGTFDGGGYTISNLKIDSSDSNYLGLFAYIATDGVVKNLALNDVKISGYEDIGGIAGDNWGTIENCSVSGSVSGSSYYVGGIAGYNWSTISDCSASGSIIGMYGYTGGIAGGNEGEIIACHNAGDVSLEQSGGGVTVYVGGIVGNNSNCVIACYNTGNVGSGFSLYSGGIVGDNYGEIIACYSIGDLSGKYSYSSGGIVGSYSTGKLQSNYWAKGTEGTPELGIGNKKSNDNATEVDGLEGNTWADATEAMNDAITGWNKENSNKCDYHFMQNDGESEPLVLEKGAPATT